MPKNKNNMTRIDKKNIADVMPLTPLQEGMLFHYLKDPKSSLYLEQLGLEIAGMIDEVYFEKAWNQVISAHEMLRTVFRWEKINRPVQMVLKEHSFTPVYLDLTAAKNGQARHLEIERIKSADLAKGFDLRQVPFRVTLNRLAENHHFMIISHHHILYDGWSTGIVLGRFFTAYRAVSRGQTLEFNTQVLSHTLKATFKDFVQWLHSQDKAESEAFWSAYLQGIETRAALPFKKRKKRFPGVDRQNVCCLPLLLAGETGSGLHRFLRENRLTPAVFFYTAWGILVQKYCLSGDVVFGVTVSGRNAAVKGIEDIVGLFINTLPLRVREVPGESIDSLLHRLAEELPQWETFSHTPLVDIRHYSGLTSGEEMFDTLVVIENYPLEDRLKLADHPLSIISHSVWESTNYDLAMRIAFTDPIKVEAVFDGETCGPWIVRRLLDHLNRVISGMLAQPDREAWELDMLLPEEKNQLLIDFNAINPVYPNDRTLPQLFSDRAQRCPDHLALVGRELADESDSSDMISLTYSELDRLTDRLAGWLQEEKGIRPGERVGISLNRSNDLIIAILGILKAGCAYVPLNPRAPAARNRFILEDTGAEIVIGQTSPPCPLSKRGEGENGVSLAPVLPKTYLAYVIYTSGSSGQPKGVPISHQNLSPLLHWGYHHIGLTPADRTAQNLSYYFDWSNWEIFITLTTGASLYMVSEELLVNGRRYIDFIRKHDISVLHITPTHFQSLAHAYNGTRLSSLKHLAIGAEKLTVDLVARSLDMVGDECRVYNMYGPTEATIMAAVLEIDRQKLALYRELSSVPIGQTLGNTALLILDRHFHPCPVYVTGELFIAGDALARGYLNNPELTAERFVFSPLTNHQSPLTNHQSPLTNRLYRTGDLCRWLPDGTIEFLGRVDQQVKIRGFRIELGEIENRLLAHPAVKETVVLARQDQAGEKYLCAYFVSEKTGRETFTPHDFHDFLALSLPDYMIPAHFIPLDRIPLNPNGKVDIAGLPEPAFTVSQTYQAPCNTTEKALVDIWAGVLAIDQERIGIDDDFFALGGHSLKLTMLTGRLHKELQVELSLVEVYERTTIRELAAYIDQKQKTRFNDICPVEERHYYPLSPAQKRLFILHQLDADSIVYNIHALVQLTGKLPAQHLQEVFRQLIARHESLRTSFHLLADGPVQRVHGQVAFELEVLGTGGRGGQYGRSGQELIEHIIKGFIRPFDLGQAPLLRVGLVKLAEEHHILALDMHHIISDGTSMGIFVREFMGLFEAGKLLETKVRYRDFVNWFDQWMNSQARLEAEQYWLKQFSGEIPILNLPTDFTRPAVQVFSGAHIEFILDREETEALKTYTLDQHTTLFTVLLATFSILLAKLGSQEDIVIGAPVAGRRHAGLYETIGMFVNTLALRNYPQAHKGVKAFIREVGASLSQAFENQDYPFEELVDRVAARRDTSRNPLFDVMFSMLNVDIPTLRLPGLQLTPYRHEDGIARFDLLFICRETSQGLDFTVEYCTRLFKPGTMNRYITYFQKIVADVLEGRAQTIGDIEMIGEAEKEEILCRFNAFEEPYPADKTIMDLFQDQAARTPDVLALVEPGTGDRARQVTYTKLAELTDDLALDLKKRGALGLVAILAGRSVDMIVGILGILKAGCAYVPLNPKAPEARNRFILDDTGAEIVIGQTSPPCPLSKRGEGENGVSLAPVLPKTYLAYVIYTSGSSGQPKGVPISHQNLSPLLHWGYRHLGIGSADRTIQNLSYYFDWSVWEIFITLTTGACLYTVPEEMMLDAAAAGEFMTRHGITVLHATPSQFLYLAASGRNFLTLKYLCLGAEKLAYDLAKRSLEMVGKECRVFNMYGPTEATIMAAVLEIDGHKLDDYRELSGIPIGRPIANIRLLILDKSFKLCPQNIAGELYIGGDALARGYLNNPELTAERFVDVDIPIGAGLSQQSPSLPAKTVLSFACGFTNCGLSAIRFSMHVPGIAAAPRTPATPHQSPITTHLYKTGDLCRWLPDGNIEFLGRVDQQVKIRGFRIELGEIENRLSTHRAVKEAVVIDRTGEGGDKYLCAYIVPEDTEDGQKPLTIPGLRDHLSAQVPDYMIPAFFVFIDKIPLNPNGKVDRRALPEPGPSAITAPGSVYNAPGNAREEKLAHIWAEVLSISRPIGRDENFFDIGGHSLKATLVLSRIRLHFEVKLALTSLFMNPTIRKLAAVIGAATGDRYIHIEPAPKMDYHPLSSSQKRLYILHYGNPASTLYNIPEVFMVGGDIDRERLENTFRLLIDRHESFRTSFGFEAGQPMQRVLEQVAFELEAFRTGGRGGQYGRSGQELIEHIIQGFIRPFDLGQAPLLRVGLTRLDEQKHLLLLDFHHIITDGTSMKVLIDDFIALYTHPVEKLPPLALQYKDFAVWQNSINGRQVIDRQAAYWLDIFKEPAPRLNLLNGHAEPEEPDFKGDACFFSIGPKETAALRLMAREEGATLFMLLLSMYVVLLHKLTWNEDIVVGTPVMGRDQAELQPLIGFFVNTLLIRSFPVGEKSFREFLAEVKKQTLSAFENALFPLDELVERTGATFNTLFSLQNLDIPKLEVPGLFTLTPFPWRRTMAKTELVFTLSEEEETLNGEIEYRTNLFKESTIKTLVRYFKQIIAEVSANRNMRIKDISLSTGYSDSQSSIYEEAAGDFGIL